MFNWVCPECGRTVDLSEKECPSCSAVQPDGDAAPSPAAAPAVPARPAKPRPARDVVHPVSATPRPHAFAIRASHVWIFLLAVLAAIGGALYLAKPDLLQLDRLAAWLPSDRPEPPPAPPGPIEATGVRVWIDEENGPQARALLVNQAAIPQRGIQATVRLRSADPELPPEQTALGEFRLVYEGELEPRASVELDAPLRLEDGITELPPRHWILIDVDFRR